MRCVSSLVLLVWANLPGSAADLPLRADSDLVLLPVTVTNREGGLVLGLSRDQFHVLDNGEARTIVSFEREDAPLSMVLVVDTSASMRSKMARTRAALENIAAEAGPEDEAALVTFANRPQVRCGFTRDFEGLVRSLEGEQAAGETSLIDGVRQALETVRGGRNARKAVVVISDGGDNHSRHTASELMTAAQETEAQVYAIAIHEQTFSVLERCGSELLEHLSGATGGLHFEIRSAKQLSETAGKIGEAIRNLYVIGFQPPEQGPLRKWHKVCVQVAKASRDRLRVSAKSGYFRDCAR